MTSRTSRGTSRRHWFARLHRRATCEKCGTTSRRTYCDVCGYEVVRRTRDAVPKVPNV